MIFWLLAFAATAIACAALYYAAAGRPVNALALPADPPELAHLRLQLREIESDIALGRLGPAEGLAAKGELAREVLRLQNEAGSGNPAQGSSFRALALVAVAATAVLAFGIYGLLGNPTLPAAPRSLRADLPQGELTFDAAIQQIEARLAAAPDDLRGWTVVAPAYMNLGRFADAAAALRRVIALDGPTADRETDLGEALMLVNGGNIEGEALHLFTSAAARDPGHVRSRFYLAGHLSRSGNFAAAAEAWREVIGLAEGGEPWLPMARSGLAAAEAGMEPAAMPDPEAIAAMVDGLALRLGTEGGSIVEWTQLVRSQLVLGRVEAAQEAYRSAVQAFPDASARTELDAMAADNGLETAN